VDSIVGHAGINGASSAGISVTISNPVISAAQGVNQTAQLAQATTNVNDGRMKAL